jgi:copper chaperone CopZ
LLGGASFAQSLSGARYAAQAAASMGITGTIGNVPTVTNPTTPTNPTTVVNVTVQGTVMSDQDLKQAIIDATNNSASSGNLQIIGSIDRLVAI